MRALDRRVSGLHPDDFSEPVLATWIGRVDDLEASPLPASLETWECRNNRLAWLALCADGFADRVDHARRQYGDDGRQDEDELVGFGRD